jgi:hypothetical protein
MFWNDESVLNWVLRFASIAPNKSRATWKSHESLEALRVKRNYYFLTDHSASPIEDFYLFCLEFQTL